MKHLIDIVNLDVVRDMKFKPSDQLLILCNNTDMVTIDQVTMLSDKKVSMEFVRYEQESDRPVLFGYLLGKYGSNICVHGMELPGFLEEKAPVKRTRPAVKGANNTAVAKTASKKTTSTAKTASESTKKAAKKETPAAEKVETQKKERTKRQSKVTEETTVSPAKDEKSDDPRIEALKKLLKITAEDIQYSFNTNFMMGRIISYVSTATTDEDVRNALEFNFRSDTNHLVADAVMKNLAKVRKIIAQ